MSLLEGQRLAVVDVETTGWSPAEGATVVEIARVSIESGVIGDEWSSLIGPQRTIPPEATRIHGITEAMLDGAPEPAHVARTLRESCEGATLVFHNAGFDVPFVTALMREAAVTPLWNPVIDTLGLARGLFGTGSNSLGPLATRLGIPLETSHRALGDARTTARLLLLLLPRWIDEKGARSLDEIAAASQDVIRATARRNAPQRRREPVAAG